MYLTMDMKGWIQYITKVHHPDMYGVWLNAQIPGSPCQVHVEAPFIALASGNRPLSQLPTQGPRKHDKRADPIWGLSCAPSNVSAANSCLVIMRFSPPKLQYLSDKETTRLKASEPPDSSVAHTGIL